MNLNESRDWEGVLVGEGGVTLPFFTDMNGQLRIIPIARDRTRWERDGWEVQMRAPLNGDNRHYRYPVRRGAENA